MASFQFFYLWAIAAVPHLGLGVGLAEKEFLLFLYWQIIRNKQNTYLFKQIIYSLKSLFAH